VSRSIKPLHIGKKAFFMYGFSKNELDNIDDKELKALKAIGRDSTGLE